MEGIGIDVLDLHKTLGSNKALDGVSLRFEAGSMHGLIGPEGAGKTTLLRTLMDVLHPDRGEIRYTDGGRAVKLPEIRDRIAYMPQRQSLYADLSITEHLDFFRALYDLPEGEYRERRAELLHMTRLGNFLGWPAGQLSGGMYKKLGLMCALLPSPRAVLLDEPTNGVDPISRREFWELLYELAARKILIIVATSYMDEAERCARVHLLSRGRVLAEGEPRQLLEAAREPDFDHYFIRTAGGES